MTDNSAVPSNNQLDNAMRDLDWFNALASGDMEHVTFFINSDPKRYIYELDNEKHMINKCNENGISPLEICIINGHLEQFQYLLEKGAQVTSKNMKPLLVSASSWSHSHILEYLLDNFEWKKEDLKSALKVVDNKSICMKILKDYQKKKYSCSLTCCFK